MSVFMLVLIYICGKIWVRCRERWEFHWPYRFLRCCYRSSDARDSNDDDAEAKNDVLCYLCNKKVPFEEWNNSETGHRRYCAVRSKDNRGKYTFVNMKLLRPTFINCTLFLQTSFFILSISV